MKKELSIKLLNELVAELANTTLASGHEIQVRQENAPGLARINNEKDNINPDV